MDRKKIFNELKKELILIDKEEIFSEGILNFCDTDETRIKLLQFIKAGNRDRKKVLLMASQIAIENGRAEGELIEE